MNSEAQADSDAEARSAGTGFFTASSVVRAIVLVALGAVGFWVYQTYGDVLTLDYLATKESQLRDFQREHPYLVYGVAFAVYVLITGMSFPGAAVLTLVFSWYFGFARALLLISFASTAGATVAFLLSRYLLRDIVQRKFGDRLSSFNESLEREGAFYLFTLRLIPAVPFFVINLVMGLTPMNVRTYWWVSQVGMLPGTMVYVYAGSQFPDLKTLAEKGASGILTPQLFIAFAVLGLFPLVAKKLMAKFKQSP